MKNIAVLDDVTLGRTITRLSHEIIEKHGHNLSDLVIIGIRTRGIFLAKRIVSNIQKFEGILVPTGEIDITLYRDDRHEVGEADPILNGTDVPIDIVGKQVVLVDDVLFTGRTIRSAMDAVMDLGRPKRITAAVLVDRGHRELPIKADYVGKNLPTSLKEQVSVQLLEYDGVDSVVIQRPE